MHSVAPNATVWRALSPTLPVPLLQLGGGGKSAIGEFMRNMRQQNDNFEEQLLKLVRLRGLRGAQLFSTLHG